MSEKTTDLEEAHRVLRSALDALAALKPKLVTAGADTNFAVGEAAGHVSKAKALLGRDIDEQRAKANG